MDKVKEIDVCSDPVWTLLEWRVFINNLIKQYGKEAVMRTDGGYNNVSLIVREK